MRALLQFNGLLLLHHGTLIERNELLLWLMHGFTLLHQWYALQEVQQQLFNLQQHLIQLFDVSYKHLPQHHQSFQPHLLPLYGCRLLHQRNILFKVQLQLRHLHIRCKQLFNMRYWTVFERNNRQHLHHVHQRVVHQCTPVQKVQLRLCHMHRHIKPMPHLSLWHVPQIRFHLLPLYGCRLLHIRCIMSSMRFKLQHLCNHSYELFNVSTRIPARCAKHLQQPLFVL